MVLNAVLTRLIQFPVVEGELPRVEIHCWGPGERLDKHEVGLVNEAACQPQERRREIVARPHADVVILRQRLPMERNGGRSNLMVLQVDLVSYEHCGDASTSSAYFLVPRRNARVRCEGRHIEHEQRAMRRRIAAVIGDAGGRRLHRRGAEVHDVEDDVPAVRAEVQRVDPRGKRWREPPVINACEVSRHESCFAHVRIPREKDLEFQHRRSFCPRRVAA
mmetsp:Transcript_115778/g.327467  ORF Transcript_115778/g.327467 Transcript_115778/m.327467 type:complete len:220 (+) Transcript_115778:179-838(+)